MGSSPSRPQPAREAEPVIDEKSRALDLLRTLHRGDADAPGSVRAVRARAAPPSITRDCVARWSEAYESLPAAHKLAGTFLQKEDWTNALVQRKPVVADLQVFNVKLSAEAAPITNQMSSGRCWLFATTNVARLQVIRAHNLGDFQLSQSYLFFYDSLEKANWYLTQMIDLADEPLDSRTVSYLSKGPEGDGGQWDMVNNLISKYGLVPQTNYPESYNSSNSAKLNTLLHAKLREYCLELRAIHASTLAVTASRAAAVASAGARKDEQMAEVWRVLVTLLGTPPKADEAFTWDYYDKAGKYNSLTTTPLGFYKDHTGSFDTKDCVSLIHDPRNKASALYTVDRLGNVVGGSPVLYVNTDVQTMKSVAVSMLKKDLPVWFGCDVGKSCDRVKGFMDTRIWDLEAAFGTGMNMNKAERLMTGESAMTHAMCLNAVHLDADGKPVRWRVENSWSDKAGDKGYFLMEDNWWDEYLFQVVAPRKFVPKELLAVLDAGNPTVLPPWDPMGALA